jgi:nitroreductase
MAIQTKEIEKQLEWRYAAKAFDSSKKIPEEKWALLEKSLLLAPSSYGLQPWKFLVVTDPALRGKLKPVSWNQGQITDASHLVVLAARKEFDHAYIRQYIDRIAEVRGLEKEKLQGFEQMMITNIVDKPEGKSEWARRQAYIAMGFLLETAALLEVDACPMEGFDPTAYDELLRLQGSAYGSVSVVALGYRAETDALQKAAKVRLKKEDLFQYL